MAILPHAFQEIINSLGQLPGVGPRTAERYAYFLFKNPPRAIDLSKDISKLSSKTKLCEVTFALIDNDQQVSPLYSDPKRDKQQVALVAEPFDIVSIERTGHYNGTYHVIGGLISPIDGINPDQLRIKELVSRINRDKVTEVIVALNATVEGESTALYIQKQLPGRVKVTRLARGLPVGLDLEYADQITLGRALEGRTTL